MPRETEKTPSVQLAPATQAAPKAQQDVQMGAADVAPAAAERDKLQAELKALTAVLTEDEAKACPACAGRRRRLEQLRDARPPLTKLMDLKRRHGKAVKHMEDLEQEQADLQNKLAVINSKLQATAGQLATARAAVACLESSKWRWRRRGRSLPGTSWMLT